MSGAVADASLLIAFAQIGQLPLLEALFGTLVVTPAVAREIASSVPREPWMVERQLVQPIPPRVLKASLGAGETEAISCALELHVDLVLVDDRAARRLAEDLGLNVVGTLGVLLAAKRKGLIPAVGPLIKALLDQNFWISPRLVESTLLAAGEVAKA